MKAGNHRQKQLLDLADDLKKLDEAERLNPRASPDNVSGSVSCEVLISVPKQPHIRRSCERSNFA